MAGSAYNLTYVKKKAHSLIERLSESELEEILHLLERISERKPTGSVEEGWRAFEISGGAQRGEGKLCYHFLCIG